MTGVAVVQFAPGTDRDANLAHVRAAVATAVERGASLVVCPEYSSYFSDPMGSDWAAAAEPIEGPFVSGLATIARDFGVAIVAGFIEATAEASRFSNTVVALDAAGTVVATYRKVHLYDAFGAHESDWVVAGDVREPETFRHDGFTVGLQTCYDLRFPESTRVLADAGVDLVIVPAEWVRGPLKEHHWRTLVTARAIENTVFVAAADHAPPVGAGNSMVVDPMGVELVTIGEAVDVAVAHIDPARVAEVRAVNPALALRRYRVTPR